MPVYTQPVREVTLDRTDPDLLRPQPGTFEARASLAFRFLAFLGFSGVVFALVPTINPVSNFQATAFGLGSLALGSLYVVVSLGVDRRRPWAIAAARPMLLVAGVAGVGTVAVAASDGHIRLPFEVVVATWAWLGARAPTPVPRLGLRGGLLSASAAALLALLLFARPLFGWGGAFDVHAQDLTSAMTVDCGAPGAGPPENIRLTYEWSWHSTSLLPNGVDFVVLGWNGVDAEGRTLYIFDKLVASGNGVYVGLDGYPSRVMATQIGTETRGSFRLGIKLAEQRYQPGRIEVVLRRTMAAPAQPDPLVIKAPYVHLGIWRHDVASVTCAW